MFCEILYTYFIKHINEDIKHQMQCTINNVVKYCKIWLYILARRVKFSSINKHANGHQP